MVADGQAVVIAMTPPPRQRHRRAPAIPMAFVLAAALMAAFAQRARAAEPDRVPLSGYSDVVVDDAHHRIFVSAGAEGPGVAVFGFDGKPIRTIGPPGASGLALVRNDLYVAATPDSTIDVVDTGSLRVTRSIPLKGWTLPGDLAVVRDRVWFFGQPRGGTLSELASVPIDGTRAPHAAQGPIGGTTPRFVEGAGGDTFLYTYDLSAHPGISRYRIQGSDVAFDALKQDSSTVPYGLGSPSAVAVPGRDTILMATGRTDGPAYDDADAVTEVSGQTLTSVMTYPVQPVPDGVAATAADGGLLAVSTWTRMDRTVPPVLWVFRAGDPKVAWTTSVPGPDLSVLPFWSGDGSTLFVIGGRPASPMTIAYDLMVVHPFTGALGPPALVGPAGPAGKGTLPVAAASGTFRDVLLLLPLAIVMGALVGFGARSKGYGPLAAWWAFGACTLLIAAIVLLRLPRRERVPGTPPLPPPPAPPGMPVASPG